MEPGFTNIQLCVEHWGHGLAVEAAHAVLAHAYAQRGALAVVAGHHPENHASRRTLEKLGMRYLRHELFPPTGLEHPLYVLPRAEARP